MWQSGNAFFGYRFNCTGGSVQVKRNGNGVDVRFVGNAAALAIATPVNSTAAGIAVGRNADGSFHVATAGDAPDMSFPARDFPFVIIVI